MVALSKASPLRSAQAVTVAGDRTAATLHLVPAAVRAAVMEARLVITTIIIAIISIMTLFRQARVNIMVNSPPPSRATVTVKAAIDRCTLAVTIVSDLFAWSPRLKGQRDMKLCISKQREKSFYQLLRQINLEFT